MAAVDAARTLKLAPGRLLRRSNVGCRVARGRGSEGEAARAAADLHASESGLLQASLDPFDGGGNCECPKYATSSVLPVDAEDDIQGEKNPRVAAV